MALRCLDIFIHVTEVCLEGRISQNFDMRLSFCFMVCRKRKFAKITKQSQKLPFFFYKIQSKAYTENLRHASLDENVFYICLKVGICRSSMKRVINVQKKSGKISNIFALIII